MSRDNIDMYPDSVETTRSNGRGYNLSMDGEYNLAANGRPMSNQDYFKLAGGCSCMGGARQPGNYETGINPQNIRGGKMDEFLGAEDYARKIMNKRTLKDRVNYLVRLYNKNTKSYDQAVMGLYDLYPSQEAEITRRAAEKIEKYGIKGGMVRHLDDGMNRNRFGVPQLKLRDELLGKGIEYIHDKNSDKYRHVTTLGENNYVRKLIGGSANNISDIMQQRMRAYLIPDNVHKRSPLEIKGNEIVKDGHLIGGTINRKLNSSSVETYLRGMVNAENLPRSGSDYIKLQQVSPYDRDARDKFDASNDYIIYKNTNDRTVL